MYSVVGFVLLMIDGTMKMLILTPNLLMDVIVKYIRIEDSSN